MVLIVIPAYKPDQTLATLVDALTKEGFSIIVVDDGSGTAFSGLFTSLKKNPAVKVLHHAANLGKGQALKTAFNFFLLEYPNTYCGLVTADADGQHLTQDILRVAQHLKQNPHALSLGMRSFQKNVPLRSRFGNVLTRTLFRFFSNRYLQDTQTGLRGIPREFLKKLIQLPSGGYDFELDMLFLATKHKILFQEVPIKTVYLNANKSSHFNPLKDSVKIYSVFFRYLFNNKRRVC